MAPEHSTVTHRIGCSPSVVVSEAAAQRGKSVGCQPAGKGEAGGPLTDAQISPRIKKCGAGCRMDAKRGCHGGSREMTQSPKTPVM